MAIDCHVEHGSMHTAAALPASPAYLRKTHRASTTPAVQHLTPPSSVPAGFGRIGRLVMRVALMRDDIEVVSVNDPFLDPSYMAYMLKFDSVHGRLAAEVSSDDSGFIVNGSKIKVHTDKDPGAIPWGDDGVDYVIEASGARLHSLHTLLLFTCLQK